MAWGDKAGYATTDPSQPRAFGVCDGCGAFYNLRSLRKQMQWMGPRLVWDGTLVCERCYCQPQPQLRPIRIPPDPVPVANPRPEPFSLDNALLGFTAYVMWAGGFPIDYTVYLTDSDGNPILFGGNPVIIDRGHDGIALLAQLAEMTGIPVPATLQTRSGTIAEASVAQSLVTANPARSYIAIFNPCSVPIGVCTAVATAELGVFPTINIGAGGCLFWASAQGTTPYAGAMTVVGPVAGLPFYCFESP